MADKSNIPVKSMSVLPIEDGRLPGSVNATFKLINSLGVNQLMQGPGFPVGHQGIVRVKATNGLLAGNAALAVVGMNREAALAGATQADALPNGAETTYPVDNLAQLFFLLGPGDGVQITVKGII